MSNVIDVTQVEKVKGYKRLTNGQQELFARTYIKHMDAVEDKSKWVPKHVSWQGSYLRVVFENGEWLHYIPGKNWY